MKPFVVPGAVWIVLAVLATVLTFVADGPSVLLFAMAASTGWAAALFCGGMAWVNRPRLFLMELDRAPADPLFARELSSEEMLNHPPK